MVLEMEAAVREEVLYLPASLQMCPVSGLKTGVAVRDLLDMEARSRHPLVIEIGVIVCEGFLHVLTVPSPLRQSVVEGLESTVEARDSLNMAVELRQRLVLEQKGGCV